MAKYSRVHRHDVSYLSKSVRKELTIKYDVFNLATKTLEIEYDIFILSGIKSLELIYDSRQLATKTLELEYDLNGDVLAELEIIYTNWGGTGKGFPVSELPMPTIDPKHKVTNIIQIPIKARLLENLENRVPTSGRLKDRYVGKIEAKTNKFYKVVKTNGIDSRLVDPQHILFDILGQLKNNVKSVGLKSKLNFRPILEMIRRNLLIIEGRVETFTFEDTNTPAIGDPINFDREPTFQNPSSFVGLVTYFPDTQDMIIVLNGKPYNYCNVPQRTFDAFKGADSPGAFYNRNIKGLLTCA